MADSGPLNEPYLHGHHGSVLEAHAKRTAEADAAFFLPFLKPGMRLLDVGCGPGTITQGLAQRTAPGSAIGLDVSADAIEAARARLTQSELPLAFEVGNIYAPRFAARSFDAVFAHQLLQHLGRPVDALKSMGTLVAKGGVVGVRDVDWGSATYYPVSEGMGNFLRLYRAVARRDGGEPDAGRYLRHWVREAGLTELRVSASAVSYADAEATRVWAESFATRTLHSSIADKAKEYGLATQAELEDISAAWREWGAYPDAFFSFSHTEIVAKAG